MPPAPLVPWEAPAGVLPVAASGTGSYEGGPPPFTVGALLSDTFARYGADMLRMFVVAAVASALSWLGSFAAPANTNPFARPTGFVDIGGLLALASFVVGFVSSAVLFALAEGGRRVPFGRAFRRGVDRSGWLFLTSLLFAAAFIAILLIALIPVGLFAVISPPLVIVPLLALFLAFIWVSIRLSLALPANVADNLNSIEAVKVSWRVTKPSGVWLRILGAAFLLGLLALPAAIGGMLLIFPVLMTSLFSGGGQSALLLIIPAVGFALLTPLAALLSYSAYRRLVPPFQPSWTAALPPAGTAPDLPPSAMPAPDAVPPSPPPLEVTTPVAPFATEARIVPPPAQLSESTVAPGPSGPQFRVPRLGTAGKALIALVLALDVAGIAVIPYGFAEMERFVREFDGFPGFPGTPGTPGFPGAVGTVERGQIAFADQAHLDTCTIEGPLLFVTANASVEWLASLDRRVTPADEVFLRVLRNGEVLETTLQPSATYDCLGSEEPLPGLVEGVYTYEVLVNGSVSATGGLFVQ